MKAARRLPAQHHAADFRPGARHAFRPDRPARPDAAELKALQDACAGGAKLMRHCRQCRADAVGLLGEDRGQEFTLDQMPETVTYDAARARRLSRRGGARARRPRRGQAGGGARTSQRGRGGRRCWSRWRPRAAAASTSTSATPREFQIYEVDAEGVRFVGHRRRGHLLPGRRRRGLHTLDGDHRVRLRASIVVLCAKIGDCPEGQARSRRHRGQRRLRPRVHRNRDRRLVTPGSSVPQPDAR